MVQYRDRTFGKFDPTKPLVVARQMTLLGNTVTGGDPMPDDVTVDVARRLWMSHYLTYAEDYRPTAEQVTHGTGLEWMDEDRGVSVVEGENGWYTIQAAWLGEDGEKVQGAEAAEARADEVRTEGDTYGISYAHSGGGWYLITGPGVPDDLKVKGEEAARAKVAELRLARAGLAPVDTDALVTLTVEDDEYVITAPWLEAPERFADPEAADLRQKALRAEGPPQGWTPSAEDAAGA